MEPNATCSLQGALDAAQRAHQALVQLVAQPALLARADREARLARCLAGFDAALATLGGAALEVLPGWLARVGPAGPPVRLLPRQRLLRLAQRSSGAVDRSGGADRSVAALLATLNAQLGVSGRGRRRVAATAPLVTRMEDARREGVGIVAAKAPAGEGPAGEGAAGEGSADRLAVEAPPAAGQAPPAAGQAPAVAGQAPAVAVTPDLLARIQARITRGEQLRADPVSAASPPAPTAKPPSLDRFAALPPVPRHVTTVAAFDAEHRALQSCCDPLSLEALDALAPQEAAQVCAWLAARLQRLRREVSIRMRPVHAAGDGAFATPLMNLKRCVNHQRVRGRHVSELREAPRTKLGTWLAEAEIREEKVRGWVSAGLVAHQAAAEAAEAAEPAEAVEAAEATVAAPLNVERGLDALDALLGDGAPPEVIAQAVRELLQAGLSAADPRLSALLGAQAEALKDREFKAVRAKARAWLRDQAVAEAAEAAAPPLVWEAEDAALEGRLVLLVGGDRQTEARARIAARLPGATVEWVETRPGGGVRQVQAACARIGVGGVAVVLLITKFMSHKVSDALVQSLKQAPGDVRWQLVRRGYGLAQIRQALQGALGLPAAEEAGLNG